MTDIFVSAIRCLFRISLCIYFIGWAIVGAEKEPVEEVIKNTVSEPTVIWKWQYDLAFLIGCCINDWMWERPLMWHFIYVYVVLASIAFEGYGALQMASRYGTGMDNVQNPKIPSHDHVEPAGSVGFFHAFLASFSVIIVSELGDKTFFIAAIMAMRHPRMTVFIGAISALAAMTVISVGFGWLTTYIPRAYTYYISTALFAIFGLKMLRDGYYMSPNEGQEELEEVQSDLRKREDEFEKETILNEDPESGVVRRSRTKLSAFNILSRIFLQSFTLTFLAEWGDRSQLTTIILAAREDIYGVTIGGCLGHALCTGLAVIGGRMIAQKISVRTVTIIGGVVFLVFAVTSLFSYPSDLG